MLRCSPTQTIHQNNNIYDNQEIILFVNRCLCTRFSYEIFFLRLQICFVVSFYKNNIFYQYWGLIRLMRAYFGKLPSIFSLSRYKFHNFIPWVVECTFSCKYNFVYFSSSDIFFESESVYMSCLMYSKNKLESHP